jgi:hypothetical protein
MNRFRLFFRPEGGVLILVFKWNPNYNQKDKFKLYNQYLVCRPGFVDLHFLLYLLQTILCSSYYLARFWEIGYLVIDNPTLAHLPSNS